MSQRVLIESDWNLKDFVNQIVEEAIKVLIESDWNLKTIIALYACCKSYRINRIRLEFKATMARKSSPEISGINRIRLEFKGRLDAPDTAPDLVLIESDWNLKSSWRLPAGGINKY